MPGSQAFEDAWVHKSTGESYARLPDHHYARPDRSPPDFHIRWDVDLPAWSPKDAAQKALAMQRDAQSTATVFDVRDAGGRVTRVDLTPDEGEPGEIVRDDLDVARDALRTALHALLRAAKPSDSRSWDVAQATDHVAAALNAVGVCDDCGMPFDPDVPPEEDTKHEKCSQPALYEGRS